MITVSTTRDSPRLGYHLYAPERPRSRRPVVVVPGKGSRAYDQFRAFLPLARKERRILLVPEFRPSRFSGYQSLAGRNGPLSSAEAFERLLASVAALLDQPIATVDLFGFSAGAQFSHRLALIMGEWVNALAIGAAGWYTYLDGRGFPEGVGESQKSGGRQPDASRFLRIPGIVLVGSLDTGRDKHLRVGEVDKLQGPSRLERAYRWVDHLHEQAARERLEPLITVEQLQGVGHSFEDAMAHGMGERVMKFFNSVQRSDASSNEMMSEAE